MIEFLENGAGLGGGDSFPLKTGVSGCSTGGGAGSVLLGYLVHIPFLNVHLSLLSRFLLIVLYLSICITSSSGDIQILYASNNLVIKPPYGNIKSLDIMSIIYCRIKYPKQLFCPVIIQYMVLNSITLISLW
ncbi:unnamed protein product [Musa textilis]